MAHTPRKIKKTAAEYIADTGSAVLQTLSVKVHTPDGGALEFGLGGLAKAIECTFPTQQKAEMREIHDTLVLLAKDVELAQVNIKQLRSLTLRTLWESWKTASEKKRDAFRSLLFNYAGGKAAEEHAVETFMQFVTDLTDLQIEMLKYARPEGSPEPSRSDTLNNYFPDVSLGLLRAAYMDLVQKGLVWQPLRNDYRDLKPIAMEIFRISDLGKEFLGWITFRKRA